MLALPVPQGGSDGGQGANAGSPGASLPAMSREDIRTTRRAILGRWPIREEKRQEIIDTLTTIATNPGYCGVRESVAAAKCLLDADRINMDEEARAVKGPDVEERPNGDIVVNFSEMSDEDLDRYIESGGGR